MPKISENFSEQQIDEFVDKLLANSSINMSLMPDYIEKKLYKNVFSICLGILDTVLDTVSIEFLGHKIVVDLAPNTHETEDSAVQTLMPLPPPNPARRNLRETLEKYD